MNLEKLPTEVLIEIISYLPLETLLNGLSLVSTQFYFLVEDELPRLKIDLVIDGELHYHSLSLAKFNIRKLTLRNFPRLESVLNQVMIIKIVHLIASNYW